MLPAPELSGAFQVGRNPPPSPENPHITRCAAKAYVGGVQIIDIDKASAAPKGG
jgi:hypothetical protein